MALLAAFVAGVAVALHLAILVSWHLSIEPDLEGARHADRLDAETVDAFPQPGDDWRELDLQRLRVRAPLADAGADLEALCADGCRLPMQPGTLAIFDAHRVESYDHTIHLLAPDRGDVRLVNAPWRNWAAIRALARRISVPNPLPPSVRYEAPGSRGVVTYFSNNDVERWVVYAYGEAGRNGLVVAVTGAPRELFLAVLGSIQVRDDLLL